MAASFSKFAAKIHEMQYVETPTSEIQTFKN